jgi:hypothetical protein
MSITSPVSDGVPSMAAGTFAQTGTAGASGGVVSGVLTSAVIVGVVGGKVPSDEVSESVPEQPATKTAPIKSAIGIRFTPTNLRTATSMRQRRKASG